ncbi:hypothetical protein OUHCRE2_40960 [Enterobacter asburiae]|uniref:Arc family DNA-binding protein n=1 Tax=Enterobacter quasimori TaxID=2838947 RepID=A0ABY0AN82_9ENTR|nr:MULTISPECIES: DUF6364 family protein [Enterobacter]HAS1962739.1 hypothetical protein [Enterobacter cloacae]HED1492308.1 hypothetical protein [Enterobacter hormaechei subsp. steigerwaltii]KDF64532.1 hypothetical protein P832_04745 [Enterobacter kobei]MBT1886442.1 hypothetical protein [Enterobacter mori]QEL33879.1 hypothetical protein EKN98_023670 [Enterobacter hormaechei subsp. xiangfangensis]
MKVKQLNLRFPETLIDRLKSTADQQNVSVNNLVERYLVNGLDNESRDQAEYSRMIADPFVPLSRLYHLLSDNISDSEFNYDTAPLSPAEIRFVAEGALTEINRRSVQLPWYIETKTIADSALKHDTIAFDDTDRLFPFALRHYLKYRADRATFAIENTPDNIRSVTKEYQSGNLSFRLSVEGTIRNRMVPKEQRVSPLVRLDIDGNYFTVMLGWDKYITTVRLLRYLESESWTKETPIIDGIGFTRAEKPAHWKMRNDDMEILLSDNELQYLCNGLLNAHNSILKSVMNIMIRLNGE